MNCSGLNCLLGVFVTVLLATSSLARAADYDAGVQAHKAGNHKQAMEIWKPLAEQGDARAQYSVGRLYEKGHGVESDLDQALIWYRKAADRNNADAQYRVAVAHAYGAGGYRKNEKEAVRWLTRAGENGHKKSQKFLARIYETGELGAAPDEKKARYWQSKVDAKP